MGVVGVKFPSSNIGRKYVRITEVAMSFVLNRYGFNFFLDPEFGRPMEVRTKHYKVPISAYVDLLIEDDLSNDKRLITFVLRNFLDVDVMYDYNKKRYIAKGPTYYTVRRLMQEKIIKWIDSQYERLFFQIDIAKERIAQAIFIQVQFNPIKNMCRDLIDKFYIDPSDYEKKEKQLDLLRVAGYITKTNGKFLPTAKVSKLIEKVKDFEDFANYVIGDLVLNYSSELDKRKMYSYKPYIKLTTLYYEEADLFRRVPKEYQKDDKILYKLKQKLIENYIERYGNISRYKEYNLNNFIDDLVDRHIFEEKDRVFIRGSEDILNEMEKRDLLESIRRELHVQISPI